MIIAFDVTGADTLIALTDDTGKIHTRRLTHDKATRVLLPELEAIRAGRPLSALGVIKGPGSFTGIRIGLATAMGYAAASDVQVFGFSTFDLIARFKPDGRYLAVLPAGRGRAFCAGVDSGCVGEIQMHGYEDLPDHSPRFVVEELAGVAAEKLAFEPTVLAVDLMARGLDPAEFDLEPLYVKPPDAIAAIPLLDKLLAR